MTGDEIEGIRRRMKAQNRKNVPMWWKKDPTPMLTVCCVFACGGVVRCVYKRSEDP